MVNMPARCLIASASALLLLPATAFGDVAEVKAWAANDIVDKKGLWVKPEIWTARSEDDDAQEKNSAWAAKKAAWSSSAEKEAWAKAKKAKKEAWAEKKAWAKKKEAWAEQPGLDAQTKKEAWAEKKAAWDTSAAQEKDAWAKIQKARAEKAKLRADAQVKTWPQAGFDSEIGSDSEAYDGYSGYGGDDDDDDDHDDVDDDGDSDYDGYDGYGSHSGSHNSRHRGRGRRGSGHRHGKKVPMPFALFANGSLTSPLLGLIVLAACAALASCAAFAVVKSCGQRRTVRMVTADGVLLSTAPPALLSDDHAPQASSAAALSPA